MGQAGGSTVKGCVKTIVVVGAVLAGVAVAGIVLLAVVAGRALDGLGEFPEKGCADSEVAIIPKAAAGDLAGVRRELDGGEQADVFDEAGNSPLACAGPRGHVAVVELLLDRGASPKTMARDGDRVLGDAVRFCQPEVAELLLEAGADPDNAGHGRSPLDDAVRLGDAEMVEVLLAGKADATTFRVAGVRDRDDRESTSTCPAPSDEGRAGALTALLAAGADPTVVLGGAVEAPWAVSGPLVEAALDAGADPNSGRAGAVVAIAAATGDAALVERLLGAGADPNRDPDLVEEPDPAATTTSVDPDVQWMQESWNLRARCPDAYPPSACDVESGLRAYAVRARTGLDGVPEATEHRDRLSARDRATEPALTVAAWDGNAAMVRVLLAGGADAGARSPVGLGALHAAAASGNEEVVLLLVSAEAALPVEGEPSAETELTKPSEIAEAAGHLPLAKVLRAAGR